MVVNAVSSMMGVKGLPAPLMLNTPFITIRASSAHSPLCARLVNLVHTCLLYIFVGISSQRRYPYAVLPSVSKVREYILASLQPCLSGVHNREAFSKPQLAVRCSCLCLLMSAFQRVHKTETCPACT